MVQITQRRSWAVSTAARSHRNYAFLRDLSTVAHPSLSVVVSMADGVQVVEQVLLLSTTNMVMDNDITRGRRMRLPRIGSVEPQTTTSANGDPTVLSLMQDGV